MRSLTSRQREVLDVIRTTIARTGIPPTRVEISRALGFKSPNAAEDHFKALAKKQAIKMVPGIARGISIPDQPQGLAWNTAKEPR